MLSENTRRLLSELDWVELQDRSSNHWQKLKRWKEQSITSLEDLALIANKTPDKMQDSVFTAQKIEPLIEHILKLNFHGIFSSVNKLDVRRTQLCTMLVRNCIQFCKLQYDLIEQDSPGLTETIISQLDKSVKICDEIANKVEITNLRNIGTKTKLEFLFNW